MLYDSIEDLSSVLSEGRVCVYLRSAEYKAFKHDPDPNHRAASRIERLTTHYKGRVHTHTHTLTRIYGSRRIKGKR